MKKLIALLLACLLFLSACGRTGPEITTETTTTTPTTTEATTEEPTTKAPSLPATGESNGVRWRTLDLSDKTNAALKEELLRQEENSYEQTEFRMSSKKIVQIKNSPGCQIKMVDETGKQTVLLETIFSGDNSMSWQHPIFHTTLDDRYFLFTIWAWTSILKYGIYDTREMKEIPFIDTILNGSMNVVKAQGDYIYFVDAVSEETYSGEPHLYRYDWTAAIRGEPVTGVDLLAGFNGEDTAFGHVLLTDDLRYYLALEGVIVPNWRNWGQQIRIYDLANKKLLPPLPEPDYPVDILREWNGKVYWVKYSEPDYALEITLP